MRRFESAQDLLHDLVDPARRERGIILDDRQEIVSVEELHRDEEGSVGRLAEVDDVQGVGVAQAARCTGLAVEALLDLRVVGQVLVEHLDGDVLFERQLSGFVDAAHRPFSEELHDLEFVGDGPSDHRIGVVVGLERVRQRASARFTDFVARDDLGAASRTYGHQARGWTWARLHRDPTKGAGAI